MEEDAADDRPKAGKKTKVRMNARDRRRMILKTASHLFAQKGLYGVTTKEIAQACGVSEPVLYQHFKTKDEIYYGLEILCEAHAEISERIISSRKPSTETLCLMVYTLNTMIVYSRRPGQLEKSVESENLTRLAGQSLVADGAFAKVLLKDGIGRFFGPWKASYKAALSEGHLTVSSANEEDLWICYELMIGSALFQLHEDRVLGQLHASHDLIERLSRFMLRGLGLKASSLETYFQPRAWEKTFEDAEKE